MPKEPKGQKRPADVIGNAVRVMRIATGEAEEYDTSDEGTRQPALPQRDIAAVQESGSRGCVGQQTRLLLRKPINV